MIGLLILAVGALGEHVSTASLASGAGITPATLSDALIASKEEGRKRPAAAGRRGEEALALEENRAFEDVFMPAAEKQRRGDLHGALSHYLSLIPVDFDSANKCILHHHIAMCHHQLKQYQEAVRWYDEALETGTTSIGVTTRADVFNQLANAHELRSAILFYQSSR